MNFFINQLNIIQVVCLVRVAFACAISLEANLLIIDEILSVGDIGFQNKCFNFLNKEFLKNKNRSVIYVGHNTEISKKICTHGLVLSEGRNIYFGDINNAIDQYKQLISTLDEKNKFNYFKNKINKELFHTEFIDLFSSRFFNRDFNRIGGQINGQITSIEVKGTPTKEYSMGMNH